MPQKTQNTPMMEQYLGMKAEYPDAFLFYRLGDFYEMFNEDAVKASQLLELTLTSRNRNADDPIPMCGIPHHAAQGYIDTLVQQGYKVAICEQVEDPKTTKGMVKREVVQLITPGTMMDTKELGSKDNNYLTALIRNEAEGNYGFAYADLSTGEMKASVLTGEEAVINECASLRTKELVASQEVEEHILTGLVQRFGIVISHQEVVPANAESSFLTSELTKTSAREAAELLLAYLSVTQKRSLAHLQKALPYEPSHYLKMDHYSKANLEITQAIRTGKKQGTLLWLLDETKTAMGGRLLKQWLDRPLIQKKEIMKRQEMTKSLLESFFEREEIAQTLTKVYDLERLAGRVAFGSVNGRDLIQLKTSLEQIPILRQLLEGMNQGQWSDLLLEMDPAEDVVTLIERAISEAAPISVTEGNVIKDGYHKQLDQYRDAMKNGKQWLAELEAKEREVTGIKGLKIGFNRVFGYYIEITKSNLKSLPEGKYERKQTLANAERFITPELKETETLILEAEEKSVELEYQLFQEVREQVKENIQRLQRLAKAAATLDVMQSFAKVSETYHYVQPVMEAGGKSIHLTDGRHPVVEKVLGQQVYIPNSIRMEEETTIALITGPNMSGKSTYMRQLALTVVMAQIGCFVPAEKAVLPIFDQIFTRIGATDDLISGQSTFMVEMMEANQALRHATPQSLILFDELGRGTATYDGMALAEAIIEYIHDHVQAKTLFSTHYHELTDLENRLPHLKNIHVGAIEKDGEVVFLHKMMDGPADKSYGIHVAKLAGLPASLLERAASVLASLEAKDHDPAPDPELTKAEEESLGQLSLFSNVTTAEIGIIDEIKELHLLEMTPMEALNKLYELQKRI